MAMTCLFILALILIALFYNLGSILIENLLADIRLKQHMRMKTYLATVLALSLTLAWVGQSFSYLLRKEELYPAFFWGIVHLISMIILYKIHCKYQSILQNSAKVSD